MTNKLITIALTVFCDSAAFEEMRSFEGCWIRLDDEEADRLLGDLKPSSEQSLDLGCICPIDQPPDVGEFLFAWDCPIHILKRGTSDDN